MANELEIINGVASMFSVKETPWHKLGHIVHSAPTAEEAIKLANMGWTVEERQIYQNLGIPGAEYRRIETHKALIRSTDYQVLGVVGKNYTPLQNNEAFKFFDPFIQSGLATFETAGVLREGRTVWILAKLNKTPIEVGRGDEILKFLLLSNGHDGTMAVRIGFTPIRVVCANTMAMAHDRSESRLIRVMHSRNVKSNVDAIQDIIDAANARFEATTEQYRRLCRSDVNQKDLEKYVDVVFGLSATEEGRRALHRRRMLDDITRLFETGRGSDLKSSKGTYWGLYNSVAEYLSYEKGNDDSKRINNLWFGNGYKINDLAFNTALQMVAA